MDIFKEFVLSNVPKHFGPGTEYEIPVLIGAFTGLVTIFWVFALFIARYETRRQNLRKIFVCCIYWCL